MSDTPTLSDISLERSREIGEIIKGLTIGDNVKATNNHLDYYIIGVVTETFHEPNGERFHRAIITQPNEERVEIHAN